MKRPIIAIEKPKRTTIAIAKVDMLFSREPFFRAIGRIGIVVPKGGSLISHSKLQFMDGQSGGWTTKVLPNLTNPVWKQSAEETGRVYHFWELENGDENQIRALKATFVWTGDGPHIVEGVVSNKHGYSKSTRPARWYDAPWFELGLELPDNMPVLGHHYTCCEGDGRHAYVEGDLPYLHSTWSGQGSPGWPSTPKHFYWGVYGFNEHSTSARGMRVSVETR